MGALKDFEIGEGGGGDVKRSDLVGVGIRERWGIDSLELEGEFFKPVTWSDDEDPVGLGTGELLGERLLRGRGNNWSSSSSGRQVLTDSVVERLDGTEESEACLRSASFGSIAPGESITAGRPSPQLFRLSTSSTLIVRVGV